MTEYYKKVCEAVDAVFGKQLIYNGEPILAAYHAISFGTTEDAANVWGSGYPYLVPVPSPGDELSPDFASTVTFTPEEFSEAVKKVLPDCALEGEADGWIGGEITRSEAGNGLPPLRWAAFPVRVSSCAPPWGCVPPASRWNTKTAVSSSR